MVFPRKSQPPSAPGLSAVIARFQLTRPARTLAENRLSSCGVPPIRPTASPYRLALALAIAWSKSSALITYSSGPNSSTSGRSATPVTSIIANETNGSPGSRRCWCRIARPRLLSR
jgi:hypothetical protein